jgi:hypothetical protein
MLRNDARLFGRRTPMIEPTPLLHRYNRKERARECAVADAGLWLISAEAFNVGITAFSMIP